MPDSNLEYRRLPRPAADWSDLTATFHHFDSERFRWLAAKLREAGMQSTADLAMKWSDEHRTVALNLRRGRGA
jgi:hypothetical protein